MTMIHTRLVCFWQYATTWSVQDLITPNVVRWTLGPFGQGLITLAGDSAHPMTPNLGQGGCCALEDAVVLARTVRRSAAKQVPNTTSRCCFRFSANVCCTCITLSSAINEQAGLLKLQPLLTCMMLAFCLCTTCSPPIRSVGCPSQQTT